MSLLQPPHFAKVYNVVELREYPADSEVEESTFKTLQNLNSELWVRMYTMLSPNKNKSGSKGGKPKQYGCASGSNSTPHKSVSTNSSLSPMQETLFPGMWELQSN